MRLEEAVAGLSGADLVGDGSVDVHDVEMDSRAVGPGALFAAVPGAHHDGHDHAAEAVAAGAAALLVARRLPLDVTQAVVGDVREALGPVAATVHGHPSRSVTTVGITGTNGKTTTAHLLANVLGAAGRRTEVLGTLSGVRTTPEAPDLQRRLAQWRDAGVQAVAMEVSSHALALHRVDGTRFAVVVFTNLSRDHLDFHATMEAYFEAKARLFTPELADRGVANRDSPYGRLLVDAALIPTEGYALGEVDDLRVAVDRCRFTWRGQAVELRLGGRFNVANALAAAGAASALGVDDATIAAGLSSPVQVPGRFEVIDAGQPFAVIVDYAHTPDGLEHLLDAASPLAADDTSRPSGSGAPRPSGRVTVVFGCGGERDVPKRPLMGEVAAMGADRVVLTADNSRGEDTAAIIEAVKHGFDRTLPRRATELVVEPDRRAALALALAEARPGDVVVVAGKGHETTQDIGGVVTPFDDREVVRQELSRLGGPS